jgi:hypothetical protein
VGPDVSAGGGPQVATLVSHGSQRSRGPNDLENFGGNTNYQEPARLLLSTEQKEACDANDSRLNEACSLLLAVTLVSATIFGGLHLLRTEMKQRGTSNLRVHSPAHHLLRSWSF